MRISGPFGAQIATVVVEDFCIFASFRALFFFLPTSLLNAAFPLSACPFVTQLFRFEAYSNTFYIRVKLSCMSSFSSVCCLLYVLTTSPHLHSTSIIMYP